jgi:PAS domain S-box-containing protein
MLADEQVSNTIFSGLDLHIAILDGDGVIVDVNDAWTRFAAENGGTMGSLGIGTNYFDICRRAISSSADAAKVLDGMLSVAEGAVRRFSYAYRCDSPTELRWYLMTVLPRALPDRGLIVAHQNNTETQQTQTRYGELLNGARAIVWRAEAPTFHTTFASKQTEQILGFPAADWVRDPALWQRRIHPDDRERVLSFSSQAVRERRNHTFEYGILAADGRVVWLRNIVNVVVENDTVHELVGVSVDITDQKSVEQERDELARALLNAYETERAAIARELHDDLGSSLALLSLRMAALGNHVRSMPAAIEDVAAVNALTTRIAADLRRVAQGLHPPSLDLLGIAAAVRQLCVDIAQHQPVAIRCDVRNVPPTLDKEIATCLLRVAQQGLQNVVKHSRAKNASVLLSGEAGRIHLQIADDGDGFDPAASKGRGGLGLASMDERLRLVRGTLTVNSAVGEGTRLDAVVPLP